MQSREATAGEPLLSHELGDDVDDDDDDDDNNNGNNL